MNEQVQELHHMDLLQKISDKVDQIQLALAAPLRPLPAQEWFSIKGVAVLMGISEKHVRRAVVGGTLPCSNVGTPSRPLYRISRKDIGEFMLLRRSGAIHTPRKRTILMTEPSPHYSPERLKRMMKSESD